METTLLNRQRQVAVDRAGLERFLGRLTRRVPSGGADAWSVCLVSDRRMRQLNREYRSVDSATDVLSFPGDSRPDPDGSLYLGDVVISVPTAARAAGLHGHTLACELQTLALHGYLHLLGYDHETDDGSMLRLQRRLQRELIDAEAEG
ncbi:MAG: rRNA maturation RNase YbeY [Acidobacteria bacterium]|nr:rRNA maturation RNase YbeY [Acidobacteriota bacterium]NIO59786.1 rRNA maturation RNase YbeY [Acidobacteriota bacterium]NIQ85942.1 rRNA maturation RNase YbeY [Acidobacteriota bacterium]NIT11485.1 rRNA maturation RNase YbeY [Acidobacteriota bacterium]